MMRYLLLLALAVALQAQGARFEYASETAIRVARAEYRIRVVQCKRMVDEAAMCKCILHASVVRDRAIAEAKVILNHE